MNKQEQMFWSKAQITANPEKCWNWLGQLDKQGYGKASRRINGKDWRCAHRIAFYLFYGINPSTLNVCHKCDNPKCINPTHLFLGTTQENILDKIKKDRQAKGENNGMAKLNECQVREIKVRLQNGEKQSALAKEFCVTFMAIAFIKQGKNWRHVRI